METVKTVGKKCAERDKSTHVGTHSILELERSMPMGTECKNENQNKKCTKAQRASCEPNHRFYGPDVEGWEGSSARKAVSQSVGYKLSHTTRSMGPPVDQGVSLDTFIGISGDSIRWPT